MDQEIIEIHDESASVIANFLLINIKFLCQQEATTLSI
jgi:hypothetical protein